MKAKIFGSIFVFLLALTFQMSAESLIWEFEAEAEADDWEVIRGEWEVDTKEGAFIASSDDDEGTAIISADIWNDKWVDYTIEARVRNMGTENHFGIGFRDDGLGNHYGFYMNDFADPESTFWFGTFNNGGYVGIVGNWADNGNYDDAEAWNVMKVVVKGFDFELYINDQLLAETSDGSKTYESGPVALVSDKNVLTAIAQFDYVTVEGEGIPSAVSAQDKLTSTWGGVKGRY